MITSAAASSIVSPKNQETHDVLSQLVKGKLGTQSPSEWVNHIIELTPDDFEVRTQALHAFLRRVQAARHLEGQFKREGPGAFRFVDGKTNYSLRLYSEGPFTATCTCRDFSRNALGVCKHLWSLLEAVTVGERGLALQPDLFWFPFRAWVGPAPLEAGFRLRSQRAPGAGWNRIDAPEPQVSEISESAEIDESRSPPSPRVLPQPAEAIHSTAPVIDWLSQVRIETKPDGGFKLEADGDAARNLAQVFQGLSALFANSAPPR
jgi:hypothetical protein